jgi:hypothetical protein
VTALGPDAVAHAARALRRIDPAAIATALPADAAARALLGDADVDGHPRPYLRHHFAALRDFYQTAAQRQLAIALWWD